MHFLYSFDRCRKLLLDLKKKKNEYDELMEKLQREVRTVNCVCVRQVSCDLPLFWISVMHGYSWVI